MAPSWFEFLLVWDDASGSDVRSVSDSEGKGVEGVDVSVVGCGLDDATFVVCAAVVVGVVFVAVVDASAVVVVIAFAVCAADVVGSVVFVAVVDVSVVVGVAFVVCTVVVGGGVVVVIVYIFVVVGCVDVAGVIEV